jgi:general secretion pathway protein K
MLNQTDPEQRWQADGTVYEIAGDETRVRLRIFAESGKIDINTSNEAQIGALLKSVLEDDWQQQQLLNAILDWRDADDDTRTQGAERRQYQQAGLSYNPSNAAFQSTEELQLVLGMNERVFNAMQPLITVYSGESEVNQRFATPEMLAILADDLKDRNMEDAALNKRLQAVNDANSDEDELNQASISKNQAYAIIAEAVEQDGASAGIEVVLKNAENDSFTPFEVMDWKQNVQGLSLFDDAMEYPLITIQDEFRYDDRH